jgi:hypothetical protein
MTDRRTALETTLTEALDGEGCLEDYPLPNVRLLLLIAVAAFVLTSIRLFVPEDAQALLWALWVIGAALCVAFVVVLAVPYVRRYLADRRVKVLTEELLRVQAGEGGDTDRR